MAKDEIRFVEYCGVELLLEDSEAAICRFQVEKKHLNPYGRVHGGMLFTIADTAGGTFLAKMNRTSVTVDSSFHFLSNVSEGWITARCELIRGGRQLSVVRVILESEDKTELAEGTFTYMILPQLVNFLDKEK